MRCNACWRELEGKAISTTCGHLLCTEDACKILSNDAACPVCDQVLSKRWQWLEFPRKFKCEAMQEKFTEKLEQVHTAYQKMAKRCQMMEQEIESLSKDKQELQEKYAEKSRQKRKLDEMYDQLRSEYESVKRTAIQPGGNFFPRTEPDLFSGMGNMMDSRDHLRQDRSVVTPETPGQREDIWPSARQKNSNSGAYDLSGGSPAKIAPVPLDAGIRRQAHSLFGLGPSNPASTLRNLIISPMKRPQLSRSRPHMFT